MSQAAAEAFQAAEAAVVERAAAVRDARAAFESDPSEATESAIEKAERELRKAERFRDARRSALLKAEAAEREATKRQARARRAELSQQRLGTIAALRKSLSEMAALYDRLNAIVEGVAATVETDSKLCEEHNALGATAAQHEQLEPLDSETVRLAFGLALAEDWDDEPTGTPDLISAHRAADGLRAPGTELQFYRRLQLVQAEAEHAFGTAALNRWLAVASPLDWDDQSDTAARQRRAAALLNRLKENDDHVADA